MRSLGGVVAIVIAVVVIFGIVVPVGWSLVSGSNGAPVEAPGRAQASVAAGDAARGKTVYLSLCYGCHAADARVGPSFASDDFKAKYKTADALVKVVRTGRHPMPPFSPEQVGDQAAADLVAYIATAK